MTSSFIDIILVEPLRSATAIVSPDQRMEYNQLIEQVFRASQEIDAKLPMFYVLLTNDEMLKELVAIVSDTRCKQEYTC